MRVLAKRINPTWQLTMFVVLGALIATPGCKKPTSETDRPALAKNDQSDSAFASFMAQFYDAWRADDQPKMLALAKSEPNTDAYFLSLVEAAEALAMPNIANALTDWSRQESMNSGSTVRIAVALVAATQDVQGHPGAKLSEAQRKAVQRVWVALYQTALTNLGTADEAPPTGVQEALDKLGSAEAISDLLADPTRKALTVIGLAWLQARTGDAQGSAKLKGDAAALMHVDADRLPWPPIIKAGGRYNVMKPQEQ